MTEGRVSQRPPEGKLLPSLIPAGLVLIVLGFFQLGTTGVSGPTEVLGPAEERVSRVEYGDRWPYPRFDEAILACTSRETPLGRMEYVTIKLGIITYGLNGPAQSYLNLPDSRTQMRVDTYSGTYVLGASSELIQRGLRLCESRR